MANIYVNGRELASKENIEYPIYRDVGTVNPQNFQDLTELFNLNKDKGHLISTRDNIPDNNPGMLAGNYGSSIIFGGQDTYGVLSLSSFLPSARIIACNSLKQGWYEDLAFRSDITKLEQEIATLKKQIGGVLTRVLTPLLSERKVAL